MSHRRPRFRHVRRRLLTIVCVFAAASACAQPAIAASAQDIAETLIGPWRVEVADTARVRQLVLHKITRANDESATFDGRYGWLETANPARVVVVLTRDANGFVLEFATADSRVRARPSSTDLLEGVVETRNRTSSVVARRATPQLADSALTPTGRATADAPAGTLEQLIARAGMAPWRGRPIDLDVRLLRANGSEATLAEFLTGAKPLVVYMYGVW